MRCTICGRRGSGPQPSSRSRLCRRPPGRIASEFGSYVICASWPGLLSPGLSLTLRDRPQLAATKRDDTCAPSRAQLIERTSVAGELRNELKILVSAVQSRPCPPFFSTGCPPPDFLQSKFVPKFVPNSSTLQRIPAHEGPGGSVLDSDLGPLVYRLRPVLIGGVGVVSQFDRPHESSSCYSPTATLGYLPAGTPRWLERIFPAVV